MIYAYLRVSTTAQDEQNQRLGVDNKAEKLGLRIDKYIIDRVSGTKEALALKKIQGVRLGRPHGSKTRNHKLDPWIEKIIKWRKNGWSKAKICKKLKVCDKTLRKYMEKHSVN